MIRTDPSALGTKRAHRSVGAALTLGALAAGPSGCVAEPSSAPPAPAATVAAERSSPGRDAPLVIIAIDSLDPDYLSLDAAGEPGGSDGDWLMPSVRAFLDRATWYPEAKAFLPSATDMNHLNAMAGTSSAQTGLIGVSQQLTGWDEQHEPVFEPMHVSMWRDDQGRPVDTLFHAFKRRWPAARTAFVSGKGWMAEQYRADVEGIPLVDHVVTATSHPSYVPSAYGVSLVDPPGDENGPCDPESARQLELAKLMETRPEVAPPDSWTVDAALALFAVEPVDMAYVLLGQMDDAGHALGDGSIPEQFRERDLPFLPGPGCDDGPSHPLVSTRDGRLFKEAMLDSVREVDRQFGRLWAGLEERGLSRSATIVLLSDHSMVTHLPMVQLNPQATDVVAVLQDAEVASADDFVGYMAASYGAIYFKPHAKGAAAQAKEVLEQHTATNPETGSIECPWLVLDRQEMQEGKGDVSPGELYHPYFVEDDQEQSLLWPDLVLFARGGWQLPAPSGLLPNLGIEVGVPFDSFAPFVGGHGSLDALPVVMAFSLPDQQTSSAVAAPARIADVGVTLAALYGVELRHTTVGHDRSAELW